MAPCTLKLRMEIVIDNTKQRSKAIYRQQYKRKTEGASYPFLLVESIIMLVARLVKIVTLRSHSNFVQVVISVAARWIGRKRHMAQMCDFFGSGKRERSLLL
jgi:hypothetical protein